MALTTNDRARVDALLAEMPLSAKLAQLVGAWIGIDSTPGAVAPAQNENMPTSPAWETLARTGRGHITRLYGTRPLDPNDGRTALRRMQTDLRRESGIGAIAHEECLTGVATWKATTFPSPPAYGSTWDPELIAEVGSAIAASMRALEVHQGLAPLLDVVTDARWGRVEECFGEDPYLVGTLGTAYVRALEEGGVVATLKHFVGYPASQGGRNLGPVHMGPRELTELLLYPFEMALREGGARAVMPSYSEIDGVPVHGDPALLTTLLRDTWGFEGTVVADYFSIAFLKVLHHVAEDVEEAARLALEAGIDVELPSPNAYSAPLLAAVRSGAVDEKLVDRALERVLRQKCELGLLDPDWAPAQADEVVDLVVVGRGPPSNTPRAVRLPMISGAGRSCRSGPGQPWPGPPMLTSQCVPNRSVHMPNVSPHGAVTRGSSTSPPSTRRSQ